MGGIRGWIPMYIVSTPRATLDSTMFYNKLLMVFRPLPLKHA
jgi:hypothetical protein